MAVAELPAQITSPVQEVQRYYELEGDGTPAFLEQFNSAVIQWHDRPGLSVVPEASLDEITHVPFTNVGTITVRFRKARPMRPRVIDVEEFDAE